MYICILFHIASRFVAYWSHSNVKFVKSFGICNMKADLLEHLNYIQLDMDKFIHNIIIFIGI